MLIDRRAMTGALGLLMAAPGAAFAGRRDLSAAVEAMLAAEDFSGSVLVSRAGEVVRASRGLACREFGAPNRADTRFCIASITKTMTAAAVLSLVAQGRVGLDDLVTQHIEGAPEAWAGITVRRLLDHSSGLPDIVRMSDFPERVTRRTTLAETVEWIKAKPLTHAPGADTVYGNSGSIVAARIVELRSGLAFPDYLRTAVYGPMGMADSGYADNEAVVQRLAQGYRKADGEVRRAGLIDMSITLGAGSEYSTVEDLGRWVEGLERGPLLPASLRDEMFRAGPGGYGLAWRIEDGADGRRISHVGDINGFGSYLLRAPEADVTVAALSNMEGMPVRRLAETLLGLALA